MQQVPRIREILRSAYPTTPIGNLMEMVASFSEEDQAAYNKLNGMLPVRICPGSFTYVRRPRVYYLS